jgi:hypothetical protein
VPVIAIIRLSRREFDRRPGNWRAVVMNVDAARGVSADMSIGAELDSVLWIGLRLLAVGGLLAAGAALAITAGARTPRGARLTTRDGKAASSTTSGQAQARCLRRAGFTRRRSRRSWSQSGF